MADRPDDEVRAGGGTPAEQIDALTAEIDHLRVRLADAPKRMRTLEERLLETKGQLPRRWPATRSVVHAARGARRHRQPPRGGRKLTQPPSAYGVIVGKNDDDTVDVLTSGRKMKVAMHPDIDLTRSRSAPRSCSTRASTSCSPAAPELTGEVVTISEVLEDGVRALVVGRADEERVCELADNVRGIHLRAGDTMRLDHRSNLLLEKLPRPEVEDLLLEEVPDISYDDIGGLDDQIEQIADAVELPFLYSELFAEHRLPAPKGILLYGPPGCGKTLIAKAVANSLARKVAAATGDEKGRSYFINIKGPELLNKYVGETERQIRMVFQRAREKSEEGWPVIVFFDEMDSMFRTRGTGVSSDMESTIVPQLLAEIDGVEGLRNVIVIGATNREDLIDPAILRPGRLDVKIKIERPNATAAVQIFSRYLNDEIPLAAGESVPQMIDATVDEMYRADEANRFLEVTYANGDKEILYFKDFASGAMIENIVRRAKKLAIKRVIGGGAKGVSAGRSRGVDQAGVQGARGPAEHDQPRRLGEDLGQEGRAHRVHPHAHERRPARRSHRRAGHRAGRHRAVSVMAATTPARRERYGAAVTCSTPSARTSRRCVPAGPRATWPPTSSCASDGPTRARHRVAGLCRAHRRLRRDEAVQRYAEIVERVRSGPPRWSPITSSRSTPSPTASSSSCTTRTSAGASRAGRLQLDDDLVEAITPTALAGRMLTRRAGVGIVVAPTGGPR